MQVHRLASLVLASLASCSAPQLLLQATYGPYTPDGHVSLVDTSGGGVSAKSSLDDIGIDEDADTPGLRADFKWGLPHLTVSTQNSSWEGSGRVTGDFGGIPSGSDVDSELDLALHRAILTFDLAPTDLLELGLGFGVSVIDFRAQITETEPLIPGTVSESADENVPVPLLAARAGGRLWRIDLEALVAGMTVKVDGGDATYLELDLNGRLAIFGSHGELNGSLVAGWRSFDFDAEYDDGVDHVDTELTFTGPYVGLQLGF